MSRPAVRGMLRPAAILGAVTLTLVLARDPAAGAWSATTADTGNAVSSAADFCPPATLPASGDTWVDAGSVGVTHGSDVTLHVRAGGPVKRALVRFSLPARPATCVLTSAELRLYATSVAAGQVVDVHRGAPSPTPWTSSGVTWSTQPASIGTAVSQASGAAPGWRSWTVTDHVVAQYVDGNNGFVLSDAGAVGAATAEQVYADLQDATRAPRLVLTWS